MLQQRENNGKGLGHSIPFALVLIVVACAGAWGGPPFTTDDPEPVDYLHWEFYLASAVEFHQSQADGTLPHIEVNYGAVPNVQVHLITPMGYVHSDGATNYGFSDLELGLKYRFVGETDNAPQVGTFPIIEIPTGSQEKDLGNGRMQVYLPVWFQKSWGKFTTYGGAGYWYNPGEQTKNWVFSGWELQYDFSSVVTLGGEIYHRTPDMQNSDSGSGFNLGGFINFDQKDHLLFSFGRTVLGEGTSTMYVGYQVTI